MSNDSNNSSVEPRLPSIVREHNRKGRRDRVGEALAAAANLHKPRTVIDWLIEYSKGQYNAAQSPEGQILWHLDPVALRSAVTQAQQRLHVVAPAVLLQSGAVLHKAHAGGDYKHLLGTKLFPSAPANGKQRTGKVPRWCEGVAEKMDTQPQPDGLSNPEIVMLVSAAVAAGYPNYGNEPELLLLARQSAGSRGRTVKELRARFLQETLLARAVVNAEAKAKKAVDERNVAIGERDEAQRKLVLLEDMQKQFEGIDIAKLAEVFKKAPPSDAEPLAEAAE